MSFSPPSILAISETLSSPATSAIAVRVRPPDTAFDTTKCLSAQTALCRAADFSADVRVDLVEDEGRRLVVRRENRLQGEHYARGLARARDRGERPRRLAGVRLEHVYDRVAAVRRRLRGGKVHAELRLQEAEVAQLLRHRLREFRGGGAAAARHLGALGAQRLFRRGEARPELAEPVVAVFERVELRALLGESRRGVSVLAAHAVHH